MATQSPFSLLDGFFDKVSTVLQPPTWMVSELQHRLVLLINHVLMQENEAQTRLARQAGRIISLRWRILSMHVQITPAGLLECVVPQNRSDLNLAVTEESPSALLQALATGAKPSIKIEGDVQLAAELNWLADHVRWDVEEDLSRVIGDAPAHAIAGVARQLGGALRQFIVPQSAATSKGRASGGSAVAAEGQPTS